MSNGGNVDIVREIIYELEKDLIKKKKFLDDDGKPIFITNVEIQNHSELPNNDIINAIKKLKDDEFIVFDNQLISLEESVEFLIRSRIYHTIWCIYKTENRPAMERNVDDFQYIRHIKRTPSQNHNLDELFNDPDVKNILRWGKSDHQLIVEIIKHLKNTTNYKKMSQFQLNSTTTIIKNLDTHNVSKGLAIVAGTGSGKSFAYQFPLLLWILHKKINKYNDLIKCNIKPSQLYVNCSAILIFPRNSLARDQNDSIKILIEKINDFILKNVHDKNKKEFLFIKNPITDFGSRAGKLDEVYGTDTRLGYPDLIITTPSSLNHRLLNPECHPVFRNGVDIILYDEIHIWEGISGAEIASLNSRLQNLFKIDPPKYPLFIGISATIDKPDLHCQKLFCLLKNDQKPSIITQSNLDDTKIFSIEHHLILKPASGRFVNGVAMESTSCLIHNRRDGLSQYHDDVNNGRFVNAENKPKSITFLDSLNGSAKYTSDFNDYENFKWAHGNTPPAQTTRVKRTYYFYNRPKQGQSGIPHTFSCDNCIDRSNPELFDCEFYKNGQCWYYSLDDAGQFNNMRFGNWHPFVRGLVDIPIDNIRSIRVSSQEKAPKPTEDKYNYFKMNQQVKVWTAGENQSHTFRSQIDHVITTPTLEVGVDFNNIKEVIQVGSIRSPSTYKQKVGRGAREGNLKEGLFAMSIIDESPLSYYHFKHFKRLITSTLDPLKLEITNPNVVLANAFLSIFDFLAFNGINLFRIKLGRGKYLTDTEIDTNYKNALTLIDNDKTKKFIKSFLDQLGFPNSAAKTNDIINDVKNFLTELCKKITIKIHDKNETHTLHEWFIRSTEDHTTYENLIHEEKYDVIKSTGDETEKILNAIADLKDVYTKFFPGDDSISKKLDLLRGELIG